MSTPKGRFWPDVARGGKGRIDCKKMSEDMSAIAIQQMADRVANLLESRLKISGKGLSEKLKRGGRKLPRKVRLAATNLANWSEMSKNPKLYLQLDQEAVAEAYDTCSRHLGGLHKWDRRRAVAENWLLSLLGSLAGVALVLVLILKWRGYI